MLVANIHADQMLCAFQLIIVQRVFVRMVPLVIQMTSIRDVRSLNELFQSPIVTAIQIVYWDKFVWLAGKDSKNASTHALQLHAV